MSKFTAHVEGRSGSEWFHAKTEDGLRDELKKYYDENLAQEWGYLDDDVDLEGVVEAIEQEYNCSWEEEGRAPEHEALLNAARALLAHPLGQNGQLTVKAFQDLHEAVKLHDDDEDAEPVRTPTPASVRGH
ncbi:hypothetical protein [Erythrobacter aureus]|uniref:Uncharacterized protein n=1 Tax=Erythrobacter aureus TaxID=2182384 RepID=A0A345YJC1_9SPHN|nr:hypothetical protein [Erythrobacter aureus]AXK44023.1 hypothetical protein DVR09_16345 [Erythrobacter aureus]